MVCLVDCIYTETTKLLKRKTFPKIYVIRLPYDTNRQYYFKNINFVVKYKRCFVTERQKGISIWFCYNYFRFFFFFGKTFSIFGVIFGDFCYLFAVALIKIYGDILRLQWKRAYFVIVQINGACKQKHQKSYSSANSNLW